MFLKITPETADSLDNMIRHVEPADAPVFLMGEDLKIIYRNNCAKLRVNRIKEGMRILRFLDEEDRHKLWELEDGMMFSCELSFGAKRYGVNLFRVRDYRIAVVHSVYAGICRSLKDIYERMSGYTAAFGDYEPFCGENYRDGRTRNAELTVLETLARRTRYRALPFLNVASVVTAFREEVRAYSPALGKRIKLHIENGEKLIEGSEQDFILILTAVLFLFADLEKDINIEVYEYHGDGFCRILVDSEKSESELHEILSSNRFCDFQGELGTVRFWLYLLKLLAEGNLWELVSEHSDDGRLCVTVRSALTTPLGSCILHDSAKEDIRKLLEIFGRK